MVKVIFREEAVGDGDEIDLPEGILNKTVTVHIDPERIMHTIVAWLEEVKE